MAAYANNRNYQYGSAAVRMREIEDPGLKRGHGHIHHRSVSIGYVLFVTAALLFTAFILAHYLTLRSDVTNKLKNISNLESQYNELKLENDATYSRINSNMDLAQIRDKAINELGMVYAKEGQMMTFTSENGDYVRQLSDIDR